jgi:hypothetical protein
LLKVVAEKVLIADDLIVERLAASANRESHLIQQERRLATLEDRVAELERHSNASVKTVKPISSGDAA